MSINKIAKKIIVNGCNDRLTAFELAKHSFKKGVSPNSVQIEKGVMSQLRNAIKRGCHLELIPDGYVKRTEENKDEKVLIEGRIFPEFFQ